MITENEISDWVFQGSNEIHLPGIMKYNLQYNNFCAKLGHSKLLVSHMNQKPLVLSSQDIFKYYCNGSSQGKSYFQHNKLK